MYRRQANRRQFLKAMGLGASAAFLAACQPPAAPSAAAPTTSAAAEPVARSEWVTGKIPADLSATFKYTSWENEAEMRKWLLHFKNFFGENYPNVKLEGDWGIPWGDYWTKMPTQLAAGAVIDMMWMHDSRCKTFAANEWLLPLDDYINAFIPLGWPDEYYPSQVKAFQYQGKQYGFPYDFASGGFYVNLDIFKEAGIPLPDENTTWTDFLEIAKALTVVENGDTKRWGVGGLPTSWSGGAYFVVKTFGGDYWNADITQSMFDNENTIAAFQYLADLIWEHKVMPNTDMLTGLGVTGGSAGIAFSSGLTAMHYSLNDEAFSLQETIENKFNWGFAPTPKGDGGQYYFTGGSAFSIPYTSTQPDLAYELLRYTLSNPEALKVSGKMGSQFTGNMNYYEFGLPLESWGVDREAFKKTFYDLPREHGIAPAYHPKYLEWEASIYQTYLDTLWTGEERDAAVACAKVHEATNALLAG